MQAAQEVEAYSKEEAVSDRQHKISQSAAGKIFNAYAFLVKQQQDGVLDDEEEEGLKLLQAAKDGNLAKVKVLLSHQVDMLHRDRKGYTCMHMAVKGGHIGVIRELAAAGGLDLLRTRSENGLSPQDYALAKGLTALSDELRRLEEEIQETEAREKQRELEARQEAEVMASEYAHDPSIHALNYDEYKEMVRAILLAVPVAGEAPRDGSRLHKFVAEPRELICGEFEHAARGFFRLLHVDEDEISLKATKGVAAIEEEAELLGDDRILKELHYILRQPAREKKFPNGVRDKGRTGMRFRDFMQHEHAKIAELKEAEVAALRLYTSPVFDAINAPLRDHDRIKKGEQHPLPVTVSMIAKGIKKLRAVGAADETAIQARVLWRGMRNLLPTDQFSLRGGTEVRSHMRVFICITPVFYHTDLGRFLFVRAKYSAFWCNDF